MTSPKVFGNTPVTMTSEDLLSIGVSIKPQFGIDVSMSNGGYLRIAQERPGEPDECVVLLALSEVLLLKAVLEKVASGEWWSHFVAGGADHE